MSSRFAGFVMTYNRPEILKSTLQRLLQQTASLEKLLVLDNGRSVQTQKAVEEVEDSRLEYKAMSGNLGPAGASAIGLQTLTDEGYDWIYWGDDDDPPIAQDTLEKILALRKQVEGPIGALGAFGSRWNWSRGEQQRVATAELQGPVPVDIIGGSGQMIVQAEAVRKVGVPNSRFFFSYEDLDFCLRLQREGYRLWIQGEVGHQYRAYHGRLDYVARRRMSPNEDASTYWRRYYSSRNLIHCMQKNFNRPDLARREILKGLMRCAACWVRGPRLGWQFFRLQSRAIIDGMRGNLGQRVLPQPKV